MEKWRRYFWPRWRLRQRIRRQGSGVQLLLSAAFGLVLAAPLTALTSGFFLAKNR